MSSGCAAMRGACKLIFYFSLPPLFRLCVSCSPSSSFPTLRPVELVVHFTRTNYRSLGPDSLSFGNRRSCERASGAAVFQDTRTHSLVCSTLLCSAIYLPTSSIPFLSCSFLDKVTSPPFPLSWGGLWPILSAPVCARLFRYTF